MLPVQLARDVNLIHSQTDRANTVGNDRVNHLHLRVQGLEAAAARAADDAERAARREAAAAARSRAAREAAAAKAAEAVAVAAELAEMAERRTLEESDHALAAETAQAQRTALGPWDLAGSDSDSGKPTGFPRFSGEKAKGSLPLTTFFEMFDLWFQLSGLPLVQKGARAQLALEGKAATQWCNLKQTLRDSGKDVYDYKVVKDAIVAQYAPISPGMTVRLHKLKQTSSVEAYHEEFRSKAAEAVNHPVKGAEACYISLAGLKAGVRERITTDPDTRDEYSNIDKLVAEAKMIDVSVFARTGEYKDVEAKGKRRGRSRSPASRKGKRTQHHGRGGGASGRDERRQQPSQSRVRCTICDGNHHMYDCPDWPTQHPRKGRNAGGRGGGSGDRHRGGGGGRFGRK